MGQLELFDKEKCTNCDSIGLCRHEEIIFNDTLDDDLDDYLFEEDKIEFTRTRRVKSPVRGTRKSAGVDFYIPDDFQSQMLKPGERVLIPAGVKVIIPKNTALIMFNKSGVASKKGLDVLACVIDEDYRGEVHINLVNTGNESVPITAGEKIVQGILIPIIYTPVVELTDEEYSNHQLAETSRGAGGFGSTGNL